MEAVPLPPTAQAVADVVGRQGALALASSVKSRTLYVPKSMPAGHWIRSVVGDEAAEALAEEYPGFILPLANCSRVVKAERNAKIFQMHLDGQRTEKIAQVFRVSSRQVRNVINQMKKGTS